MDEPDIIVGARAYLEWYSQYLQQDRDAQLAEMWRRACEREGPTHYIRTIDNQVGLGRSFAEAFSHLVAASER